MATKNQRPTTAATPQKRLRNLTVAAEYFDVTPRTVRQWIADGRLTGYRVGAKHVRVDMNEVEAMAEVIPSSAAGR
ncbi:helix-turn-helix domain-containing protein [Nocardioides sambongensis]|uniref:helix-turn-helix domain-containing protein n=1 Tax=Nocardioides sambongensis TaxID=2589074 RepID=UPI0011298E28|nr:helix-turn-helix domain-containing protein [Nocardioides sambongensis]